MSKVGAWILLVTWTAGYGTGQPDHVQTLVAAQRRHTHPGSAVVDVSADGRYVAFESAARLSPLDTNSGPDIYVIDRTTGTVTLESLSSEVAIVPGSSTAPRLSGNGRYLVFTSLVGRTAESTEAFSQVLWKDRTLQHTVLASRTIAGAPGDGWSIGPDISDDGRTVVFDSSATDLGDGADANGPIRDVYAFDVRREIVTRISGGQPSFEASISADGRFIAFTASSAAGPAIPRRSLSRPGERGLILEVFVHDTVRASTRLVSRAPDDSASNGSSFAPAISADGRWLAFTSTASNLDGRTTNRIGNVFLRDLETGRTTLISRRAGGGSTDGPSRNPTVSADGRFVVFVSRASNLTCTRRCHPLQSDQNLVEDVYRFDTVLGTALRISGIGGTQWWERSDGPAVDAAGRVIAFSTTHPIDDDDSQPDFDLWVEVLPEPCCPDSQIGARIPPFN